MSTCTAEEIAEKKRIALERLKAKKNQQSFASPGTAQSNFNNKVPHSPFVTKDSKVVDSTVKLTEKPASTFYQPQINSLNASPSSNKASEFIAALKQSSTITSRLEEARAASHPYQKKVQNHKQSFDQNQHSRILSINQNSAKQLAPVFSKAVSCTTHIVSPSRFAVVPSSYHEKLIDVFKQIPSKSYGILINI